GGITWASHHGRSLGGGPRRRRVRPRLPLETGPWLRRVTSLGRGRAARSGCLLHTEARRLQELPQGATGLLGDALTRAVGKVRGGLAGARPLPLERLVGGSSCPVVQA